MRTIPAKHILQRTPSPDWFGVSFNCNLYRGCTHDCIYCDSRSLCYQNPDFDHIYAKADALQTLRLDLASVKTPGVVGTGSMSDPYNALEGEAQLTRQALRLFLTYGFGVSIATKSDLVGRDADLLRAMSGQAPTLVNVTVTCAQDDLSHKVEPGAPSSSRRFAVLERLAAQGIHTGILLTPVLPHITDTPENILGIVDRAAQIGVGSIFTSFGMTLRAGNREYYYKRLEALYPGLARRYAQEFGERYELRSPRAQELALAFDEACDRAGIAYRMPDIVRRYQGRFLDRQTSFLE